MPDLDYRLIRKTGFEQQSASLRKNLVAYWSLDEASGTRFDSSGNGNHLTSNNGVGQAAGIIGNAASFVAASHQYLSVASSPATQIGGGSWSIAGWFYFNSKPSYSDIVTKTNGVTSNAEIYLFYVSASDRMNLQIGNGTTSVTLASAAGFSLNTWYFIAIWYDSVSKTANMQVNNGSVVSSSFDNSGYVNAFPFALGSSFGEDLDGREALFALWKGRVLTAGERSYLYNNGFGRAFPWR